MSSTTTVTSLVCGGSLESSKDSGVGAGAVEGLLDGDNVVVSCGGGDEVFDGAVAVEGVMQEDVFFAQRGEDVGGRLGGLVELEAAAVELRELERGNLGGAVEAHEAREVDGRRGAEDLPGLELEVDAEAFGDFFGGEGVDLHADGVAFAAVVQLLGDGLEQGARLFLLHVEIAVAGDAEGGAIEDAVAAEHGVDVGFDELFEKQEVALAFVFGESDERGKGARDGDDAEDLGAGAGLEFAFVAEQESEAESLVEDARERGGRDRGLRG
jgi:hypothetical protein